MTPTSTKAAATKSILIPGSEDKAAWDLKSGREIEEAWGVDEQHVCALTVSRDSRWVVTVTAGGDGGRGELKACEVEMGIVRTFEGHSDWINCIDVSADSTLLTGTDMEPGHRQNRGRSIPGPSTGWVGAIRFST